MDLMIIILLRFFILIRFSHSGFITPREISDVEESFVKGETEYIMVDLRVTWNEAVIICESYKNGTLAILNTVDGREFVSEALSESNLEMEDLWIGAKIQAGVIGYSWINGAGVYLADNEAFIKRGKESFKASRNCLAFSRKFHDVPLFINLECDLQRAFICEKPYEKIYNGSMTTPEWIHIGKYVYGIFYDRKTWKQSVRECRKRHRAHLASFRNNDEVAVVGKYLLVGRPSLENAWIGGHFSYGYWRFISVGEQLPDETNEDNLFPPWRQDRPLKRSGCLLLDRHLANHPVFLEARCERRRSYICVKKHPSLPDFSVLIMNNIGYIIYYAKKSWDDAWEQCLEIKAILVRVNKEIIHDVTYIMGENVTEINHIWIGGKLHESGAYFYWVGDNEPIPPNNIDLNHYPPWYDNEYNKDYACLNMDRENHNRPMFYGAACDTPQAFICEQRNLTLLPRSSKVETLTTVAPSSPTSTKPSLK